MTYIAVLVFSLILVAGSVAFVMSGQHARKPK